MCFDFLYLFTLYFFSVMSALDVFGMILKLLVFVLVVRFLYATIVWFSVSNKKKCEGLSYGQFLKKNYFIWDICDVRTGNKGEWSPLEFQMTHYFLTQRLIKIAKDPPQPALSDAQTNCRYTVKEAADVLTRDISADYDFSTVFMFFKQTKDFHCLNTSANDLPKLSGVFQEMCQRLTDFAKNNVICKCVKETETLEPGFKCCEGLKDDGNGKCGPTCTTSKPTDDLPCCPGYDNNNGTCTQCCQKPGYKANTSCSQGCCDGKSPDLNGYCPALNEWKDCAPPGTQAPKDYINPCCDRQKPRQDGYCYPACTVGARDKYDKDCGVLCENGLIPDKVDGYCYPPCTVGAGKNYDKDCDVPCEAGLIQDDNKCSYPPCTVGAGKNYDKDCDVPCEAGLIQDDNKCSYPPCTVGAGELYKKDCDVPCEADLIQDLDGYCYPPCTVGENTDINEKCSVPCKHGLKIHNNRCVPCSAKAGKPYDSDCKIPCEAGLIQDEDGYCYLPCTVGAGEKYDSTCDVPCKYTVLQDPTYGVCNAACSADPGKAPKSDIICDPICKDGQQPGEDGVCPKHVSFSDDNVYY